MKFLAFSLCLALLPLAAHAGVHTIIIDPGHGGPADSGAQSQRSLSASNNASSPSGLREKDLTLELSLEIQRQVAALAPAHPGTTLNCVLTRTTDINPDFVARSAFCARQNPLPSAIFSIHFNASDGHDALGTLAVIRNQKNNQNYQNDQTYATSLIKATNAAIVPFLPASKPRAPITDGHLHGGVGSNFFFQLARYPELNTVPKCFLEIEFIDRKDTDAALLQQRRATFPAIARAIATFLYTQHP